MSYEVNNAKGVARPFFDAIMVHFDSLAEDRRMYGVNYSFCKGKPVQYIGIPAEDLGVTWTAQEDHAGLTPRMVATMLDAQPDYYSNLN